MQFDISWTYGGTTTVEADTEEEARQTFAETFNMSEHYEHDSEGVDVTDVEESV